ncbi:esterase/lipase family protein [Alkalihalobacillus sp. 1P02AB]|uniref:esterase/lipase family protein n=1 Tax=Alkalihalobacillus sp. 1P02AB TaxID=3132260 RepID=UPI0039A479ED
MKPILVKTISIMLLLLFFAPLQASAGFLGIGKPGPGAPPGSWTVGEIPEGETKTPILFLHGLNGSSSTWFDSNDMFQQAYDHGHPTAYLNLYPDHSNWDNAELLTEVLPEIYQYFGEKMMVVAHSKGGVDVQTAVVHYNASEYIERVITLGSPHHGSELANLAHSSWAWWLAEIIGMRSDGTDALQTGNMAYFRSQTDPLFDPSSVPFSTISGTSWGSFGSVLYFGGLYLSIHGTNDGAVTLNSARLPGAPEIASLPLDHFKINQGHLIFPYLQEELNHPNITTESGSDKANMIVRGGELSNEAEQPFTVESGVNELNIFLLASDELAEASLHAPDGKLFQMESVKKEPEHSIFNGTYVHHFKVQTPEPGMWNVTMSHDQEASYLAVAMFEGGISEALHINSSNLQTNLDKDEIIHSETSYTVYINDKKMSDSSTIQSIPYQTNQSQTITIDIEGKTTAGQPFERTIINHRYIDKKGIVYD